MAWVTPKTNWVKTDRINYVDYNRIKNNLAYLRDLAAQLYREFDITVDPDKDNYSLWPYPSEINRLEENLETIRNHTYHGAEADLLRQRPHYRLAGAQPPGISHAADPR